MKQSPILETCSRLVPDVFGFVWTKSVCQIKKAAILRGHQHQFPGSDAVPPDSPLARENSVDPSISYSSNQEHMHCHEVCSKPTTSSKIVSSISQSAIQPQSLPPSRPTFAEKNTYVSMFLVEARSRAQPLQTPPQITTWIVATSCWGHSQQTPSAHNRS